MLGFSREVAIGEKDASKVEIRAQGERFAIVVGSEELVDFGSEAEASGVATWVRYQLAAGTSLKELGLMLRGQSKQEAEGGAAAVAPDPEPAPAKKPAKAEKKKAKAKQAEPEAAAQDEGGADGPDIDALVDGTVGALKKGLASGDYDAVLAEVLAAEKGGKGRKSAIGAIEGRIEELG